MAQLILASASPRRQALLDQLGVRHYAHAADLDETPWPNEAPASYVARIAAEKSAWVQADTASELPILAADTSVVCKGAILLKPVDRDDAFRMLHCLSGRTHLVYTAVSLRCAREHWQVTSVTQVTFREITAAEMLAYWQTGEPADKAGGYAIQGLGAVFVAGIVGSFSGVVGLPLFETANLLAQVGIKIVHD